MFLLRYARLRSGRADAIISRITEGKSVACGKGCAYCCYGVTLWLRKIEVFFLAHSLNRRKPRDRVSFAGKLRRYGNIYERESERVWVTDRSLPLRKRIWTQKSSGLSAGLP
ncbi:MAG: hypothetical protein Q9N34_02875 [Aquificota bacterium]|nr:hypothetical protein [Aquificota bacterium]